MFICDLLTEWLANELFWFLCFFSGLCPIVLENEKIVFLLRKNIIIICRGRSF